MDRIADYRDFEKMGVSNLKIRKNSRAKSSRRMEKFAAMRAACLDSTTQYESIHETIVGMTGKGDGRARRRI